MRSRNPSNRTSQRINSASSISTSSKAGEVLSRINLRRKKDDVNKENIHADAGNIMDSNVPIPSSTYTANDNVELKFNDSENLQSNVLTLSLEIEDRYHACSLLKEAIEQEERDRVKMEKDIEEKYSQECEDLKNLHSSNVSIVLKETDEILQKKVSLTEKVKKLLDDLEEADYSAEIESILMRGKEELSAAHKIWLDGEPVRKEKYIALKTKEIKERTIKGLEPEVERIKDQHFSTLKDMESASHEEERRVIADMHRKTEEKLTTIGQYCREQQEAELEKEKALQEEHYRRFEEEKLMDMTRRRARAQGEQRALRRGHEEELERIISSHRKDVDLLHHQHEEKLKTLREKGAREQELMTSKHQENIQNLKHNLIEERDSWEIEYKNRCSEEHNIHMKKENDRLQNMKTTEVEQMASNLAITSTINEKKKRADMGRQINELQDRHKESLAEVEKEILILEGKKEEQRLREEEIGNEIARLKGALCERKQQKTTLQQNLQAMSDRHAIDTAQQETEAREMLNKLKLLKNRRNSIEKKLKEEIERNKAQSKGAEEELNRRLKEVEQEHENTLQVLHTEVKEQVKELDGRLSAFRANLKEENIKANHLMKMLHYYD